jgi:outer membrane receptor for Fe3+-dicitrate
VGSNSGKKNKAGSTYFISPKELKAFNYDDVSRILRTVPGITIQEEDGLVYDQTLECEEQAQIEVRKSH